MNSKARQYFLLSLMLIVFFSQALCAEVKQADVRLLIDISGSMKQNDPQNLRVPALQLVTNLMPEGSKAGVWAFGRYVNMLVPLKEVDNNWKDQATQAAKKINSAGLYTNIREVMQKASYGWSRENSNEKRSLILLTDGMVDIAKDPQVNQAEKEKILNQLLPKLKQAKVTIHTIALSQNADHELLKGLANATDGWYQAVDSADELQKVFLKIFEQSAARDNLPLTDNKFKVDASIEEMTLLIFKKDVQNKTVLVAADGSNIESASSDGKVRWFSTDSYDLITVKTPLPGDWRVVADVDPDNRVMVVSKLGLNIAPVPNNLLAGEAINYQVSLLEDGKLISKADFLKLIEARLIQKKDGKENRLAMFFDSGESTFKQNFFTDTSEGLLELTLAIKSPTFERTRNHAVNIYGSPLMHEVRLSETLEQKHQLLLTVREDIVKANSVTASAEIVNPAGEKQYQTMDSFPHTIELDVIQQGGTYSVRLEIKGESVLAREFSVSPEPIAIQTPSMIATPQAEKLPEEPVEKQAEPAPPEETKPEPEPKPQSKPQFQPESEPAEETNWMLWLGIGLGGNVMLIIGGFFIWRLLKKKNQQQNAALADQLVADDVLENKQSPDKK